MTNKYGDAPLGKSVEEVEQETGNLVNSPVQGEVVRDAEAAVIPAVVGGTSSGGVAAVVVPGNLVDDAGSTAHDGTARVTDGEQG